MSLESPTGEKRHPRLIAALLLVLTLAVFQRVGGQDFVCWDDSLHVTGNPHLGSLAQIGDFWRHPYGGLYIPLSYTAYALVAQAARGAPPAPGMSALDPHVFHRANLTLHLLNTLLVFVILRRLLRRDWPAGAGALLFGIHPMQVESVAWISELRGLLCGSFSLLALWLWSHAAGQAKRTGGLYAAATALFLLALLSKPSAVALPLVVLALDRCVIGRPWRRCLPPMLAWLALSLVWLWVTRSAQPLPFAVTQPLWTRPVVAGDALWFYGAHLVWPAPLGPDYGRTPAWVLRHAPMTGLVPGGLALLLWRARRAGPLFGAAALFAAALLPVLGLVPFAFQWYSTVADRYIYFAMLGPALALGWLLVSCEARPPWCRAAVAFSLLVLAACGLRSVAQVRTWDNALTFTANAVAANPRSWVMHYNRGHYLQHHGDAADAAAEYRQALAVRPDMADAHGNLGVILLGQGRHTEADAELGEALRLDPQLTEARDTLALSLADQGRTPEAAAQWRVVAQEWPQALAVRYNLGSALLTLHQATAAAAQFRQALRLQPQFAQARTALAQALRQAAPASSPLAPRRS